MPRIYNSLSEPVDLCKRCFPKTEAKAKQEYGNLGEGPDDRGDCFSYDANHPDYSDEDFDYECDKCGKKLTNKDNGSYYE